MPDKGYPCFEDGWVLLVWLMAYSLVDGLYRIIREDDQCSINSVMRFKTCSIGMWHHRLGHPSNNVQDHVGKDNVNIQYNKANMCDTFGDLSFPNSISITHDSFDIVHADIWGPFGVTFVCGYRYFLTIVDDFSRQTWIFLMRNKSETRSLLENFVIYVKTQFNKCIKTIRSDNGVEFNYKALYEKNEILHQTSCVGTPQQNSVVERKHQDILNVTRSIMFHSNLPKQFWCYAVSHAIYIINRLPSAASCFKVPYEQLYKLKPDISFLKIFGCLCFTSTLANNKDKLNPRSRKCIFLGFKTCIKGYIVLDIKTRETFITRDVVFHEESFIELKDNDEKLDNTFEQGFSFLLDESTGNYNNTPEKMNKKATT